MEIINVLQYGEGNFLRCFIEYKLQLAKNGGRLNGGVAIVEPLMGGPQLPLIKQQDYRYNIVLSGVREGRTVEEVLPVNVVAAAVNLKEDYSSYRSIYLSKDLKAVVSNTTEAGIVFDEKDTFDGGMTCTFPAKIAKMLYDRFTVLGKSHGLVFLPCELIENNGTELKKCVIKYARLWSLGADFIDYVTSCNTFCNTLVDRIVTGFPKADPQKYFALAGWEDRLITVGEPYFLWAIEGDPSMAKRIVWLDDPEIIITANLRPYRERKVKVLNGMHTMGVPIALLGGIQTVGDAASTPYIKEFWERCAQEEILPTISLPEAEKQSYLASVFERFQNPFVSHAFRSIALNSISKWKARVLPTVKDYIAKYGLLPIRLIFSLSALILLYINSATEINDAPSVKAFFLEEKGNSAASIAKKVLSNKEWWGEDLADIQGVSDLVNGYIKDIEEKGIKEAVAKI